MRPTTGAFGIDLLAGFLIQVHRGGDHKEEDSQGENELNDDIQRGRDGPRGDGPSCAVTSDILMVVVAKRSVLAVLDPSGEDWESNAGNSVARRVTEKNTVPITNRRTVTTSRMAAIIARPRFPALAHQVPGQRQNGDGDDDGEQDGVENGGERLDAEHDDDHGGDPHPITTSFPEELFIIARSLSWKPGLSKPLGGSSD